MAKARTKRKQQTWDGREALNLTVANFAQAFTSKVPVCTPGTDHKEMAVKGDVPPLLEQALKGNLDVISPDTLKSNAALGLEMFESIMLRRVYR